MRSNLRSSARQDTDMPDVQQEVPARNAPPPPPALPAHPSSELLSQMVQGMLHLQQQQTQMQTQQAQQNLQVQQQAQGQAAQMMDGFQLVADRLQGGQQQFQRVGGIKDFKSLRPAEFSGTVSPIDAEEWLKAMEMLLVAAAVPEEKWVDVVHVQFSGGARAWYDVLYQTCEEDLTWEYFSSQFYEQFFPEDARNDMEERLLRLEQGTRKVDDYAYEFTQLCRVVTSLVPTEKVKARRFVKGLRGEIRKHMISQVPVSFREAHLTARRHENDPGTDVSVQGSQTFPEKKPQFQQSGGHSSQSQRSSPYARPAQSAQSAQSPSNRKRGRVYSPCSACGMKTHTPDRC